MASRTMDALVAPAVIVEPNSQAFLLDPGPFYQRLRNNHPVVPARLPRWRQGWLVTRYEDVATVLRDTRFVSDYRLALSPDQQRRSRPPVPRILSVLADNLLSLEGDRHRRVRTLVAKAFSPRRIERMRERIHGLAVGLLDASRSASRIDLVRDYAVPIPTRVILEMLGIASDDINTTHRRAEALIAVVEDLCAAWWAAPRVVMFLRTVRKLIRERRARPRDDLLSDLVQAEEAGDTLSENELFATVILLILAGHETTANLISIGVLAIIQNPEQLARLRAEPDLIPSTVEELMRYVSPLRSALRFTQEDVTLSGVTIPQGAPVAAVILSANRDERVFHQPETLDIARSPNRHLSLGVGRHFCLGAALARMEAEIALSSLLQRTVELRLAVDPITCGWRSKLGLRMLSSLPLSVGWRSE